MPGDQTAAGLADPGRRMKYTVTAGTVYGYIVGRSFGGGVTNVTTAIDSGALDSGLSAASYGLVSATHDSVPLLPGGRALFMDPTDATKRVALNLANVSTGVVRTYTVADTSDTFVMVSAAATEFNKTFVSPVLSTGVSGSALAAKADQKTGTTNILLVTPSVQNFHPSAAQAWVSATTGGISAQYNILSFTSFGTGDVGFTFASSFSGGLGSYAIIPGFYAASTATGQAMEGLVNSQRPPNATSANLIFLRSNGTVQANIDPQFYFMACFGAMA